MAANKYSELFDVIDSNKDGYIDMDELVHAFNVRGLEKADEEAKIFFARSDLDENKVLDRDEFSKYMISHEQEMQEAFDAVDANKDGLVDTKEVIGAFRSRGISISEEQVEKLVKRLDVDGNHVIDWDEWREFLLFRSVHSIINDRNVSSP